MPFQSETTDNSPILSFFNQIFTQSTQFWTTLVLINRNEPSQKRTARSEKRTTMSDQGKIEKIHKLDTKHKTASIIKLMEGKHSDAEVICAALEALGDIADEDSLNEITHYLEHEDPAIRTKACCVAAKLNTDYLNTRVRYQMSQEKDPEVKKAIQEALDHAGHIVEP